MEIERAIRRKRRPRDDTSMTPEIIQTWITQNEPHRTVITHDQYIGGWGATMWGGTVIDPAPAACWCCPTRGPSQNQRTGLQCTVVRVELTGVLEMGNKTVQGFLRMANCVELALVLDHQTNGHQLVGTDVFWSGTMPALVRYDNAARFTVLKRLVFDFKDRVCSNQGDTINQASLGAEIKTFRFVLDTNIVLSFVAGAGTGTVADLVGNSFHVLGTALNNASGDIHARLNAQFFWFG